MIELYYVKGISATDTLYFNTIVEQENYFEEHKQVDIINTNYPPHFTNTIRFTDEDLDFNSQINYLSITFNNKKYYYFIDSITYIAEDLIEVTITMDTIQTYMFNIDFINSKVTQRLIDRYNNDSSINREYLRNNISNGLFINKTYHAYNDTKTLGWYVITISPEASFYTKTAMLPNISNHTSNMYSITNDLPELYTDDTMKLLLPVVPEDYTLELYQNFALTNSGITRDYINRILHKLSQDTKVVNIQYMYDIPRQNGIQWTFDDRNYKISMYISGDINNFNGVYITYLDSQFNEPVFYCFDLQCYSNGSSLNINMFNIEHNISIEVPFDIKYIPQLLDENYIRFYYGDYNSKTSYPLSTITKDMPVMKYNLDFASSSRYFSITLNDLDIYQTGIIEETNNSLTMWSDKWNNFVATHKGSIMSSIIKTGADMFTTISGTRFLTPKRKVLSKSGKRAIASMTGEVAETTGEMLNYAFAPDTLKQQNTITSSLFSGMLQRFYSIDIVSDIEDVGRELESNGYQVHETYGSDNLFRALNTRYYFNVIKCEDLEINLNILNDETTIDNIKSRFIDGLRLWNINRGLDIGELFIYDNVETKYIAQEG